MDNEFKRTHTIDTIFVISLMLLFLISALSVIAIGASIYQKNVDTMSKNSSHRIATSYITEKIRQNDKEGSIGTREIFEKNALVISEDINGTIYNTYIYDYNGSLMELFARDDLENFYPQSGQKIMDVKSFNAESVKKDLYRISIVLDDGTLDQIYITSRSNK